MSRALHQLSRAGQGPVRGDQLRGDPREPARERAVRPREGRLHRRDRAQDRQGRAGAPGHALPRRDRRHAAAAAGQDPAARAGAAVRARGRARRRSPSTCAWWPPPTATCAALVAAEAVPRGPVLPPVRDADRDPAAAAAAPRHPAPGRGVPAALRARDGHARTCASPRTPSARSPRTPGRATCASCRTASSAPRSCASGTSIEPAHLRLEPGPRGGPSLADVLDLSGPLAEVGERAAARAEEEAIALAVREAEGDRAAAAARLGISLSTLEPPAARARRAEASRV